MKVLPKVAIFFQLISSNLYFAEQRSSNDTSVISESEMSEAERISDGKSITTSRVLPAEHRLYNYLVGEEKTKKYARQVRPVVDYHTQVVLKFGICLMSIDEILEIEQSLISTGCIKMDIALVNSPEPFGIPKKSANVEVTYSGQVGYYPTGRIQTRCPVKMSYFPLDEQICEFQFESWAYPSSQVKIELWPEHSVDLKGYVTNHQWQLKGINTKLHLKYYDGLEFDAVTFQLYFQRRSLYYGVYAIFPSFLMALLQLSAVTLPLEHPGRMGLLTALFIGFNVLQGYIASSMPKSSDGISLIQVYDMICSLTLVYSIVQTAINMHIFFRTPEDKEPSILALMKSFFITFGIRSEHRTYVHSELKPCVIPLEHFPKSVHFELGEAAVRSRLVTEVSSPGRREAKEAADKEKAVSKQNIRHRWLVVATKFDRFSFYGLGIVHLITPIYLFMISPAFQEYHGDPSNELGYKEHEE